MSRILVPGKRPAVTEWHVKALRKQMAGDYGGALHLWSKILGRNPHDAKALYFIALSCYQVRQLDRAIAYMRAALQEEPTHADAWFNMGKFLQDAGRPREALDHYIAALEHEPGKIEALSNAGNLFMQLGDKGSALDCYHQVLAQDPTRPEALYNRSFIRLLHGDYIGGWADYEARWRCIAFTVDYERAFMRSIPMWYGEALDGRSILIHAEQGFGDAMMMMRYVPPFLAAGVDVTLEVHPALLSLTERLFPDVKVIPRGWVERLEHVPDFQVPMMSLPERLGTELHTIPHLAREITDRVTPSERRCTCDRLHVGLCWAGSSTHPNDADRSMPTMGLAPILAIPGVHFTSLQVGERADEYGHRGDDDTMSYPPLSDYLSTARVCAGLDLIIAVDTSVAHLGGMLGVPTWIAVPSLPEFRWMLERADTPWYPSVLLWRREPGGAWRTTMHRMGAALTALAGTPRPTVHAL